MSPFYGSDYGAEYGGGRGGAYGTTDGALYGTSAGATYGVTSTATTPTTTTTTNGTQWRVVRNGNIPVEAVFDVEVVDTANPFGNYGIIYVDDIKGTKFDAYPRGTRIDFKVSPDGEDTFSTRLSGYVVERRERNIDGADSLEVEVYSFDQFIRRNVNDTDLSGQSIESALQTLIEDYTPVTWNASNVTVGDPQDVQRSFRGEQVENVIRALAQTSQNEAFGVNSDIEFFFEPRENAPAPRDIDNSQWFDYDIPEVGKESANRVKVWYDDGNKSVVVEDGADQLNLQDKLSTGSAVSFTEEVTRDDITELRAAELTGEQILSEREPTLTGTVTTFGLFDAEPGDTINIDINPRGIDDEFRIAEIMYRWGTDETVLTVVEKRGNQDDLLVRLSDSVKRVEMRPADRDAIENKVTNTLAGVELAVSGSFDGNSFDTAKVTNTCLNRLGDAHADTFTFDIAEMGVGNDATAARRTQTGLQNELERQPVTESTPDSTSADYQSDPFTTTDVREVALFDNNGDMLVRATIPNTSIAGTPTGTIGIDVSNDGDVQFGVVTDHGQTTVRDYLTGTNDGPTDYAYGSDGTDPTTGDTALGNQVVVEELDEILIQDADTNSEWAEITSVGDTDPLQITNSELQLAQSCFTQTDEDNSDTINNPGFVNDSKYTNGSAINLTSAGEAIEWEFTLDYTIAESDFEVETRTETSDSSGHEWTLTNPSGVTFTIHTVDEGVGALAFEWDNITGGDQGSSDWSDGDLDPGTYTLRVEQTSSAGSLIVDAVAPYDGRFNYTFDNSTDANDDLSGPELFPDSFQFEFNQESTTRDTTSATVEQTWNDTSGNQAIAISNDGGGTYTTTNNNNTATATFGSPDNRLITRVTLGRYGSGGGSTPTSGFNGQAIDDHKFFADVQAINPERIGRYDVRAVVPPGTQTGNTFREGGQLDSGGNLLTHVVFPEFVVTSNQRIISSEAMRFTNA